MNHVRSTKIETNIGKDKIIAYFENIYNGVFVNTEPCSGKPGKQRTSAETVI